MRHGSIGLKQLTDNENIVSTELVILKIIEALPILYMNIRF